MPNNKVKLLAIVGQTGSGKTDLAIRLAKKYNGELVSADSRAIYKYMNIGTAKPTTAELGVVEIHGIDLVEPDEKYSVYDFQQYAYKKIDEIQRRGRLPILVGGTGLYIDSVILRYELSDKKNSVQSVKFEDMSIEQLIKYCSKNNIRLPSNYKNRRHIISAIANNGKIRTRLETPEEGTLVVGIDIDKEELTNRLSKRADSMLNNGIIVEYEDIVNKFGDQLESMKGNVYSLVHKYLNHEIEKHQIASGLVSLDKKLAKKQRTWFKRNNFIHWIKPELAFEHISRTLDN